MMAEEQEIDKELDQMLKFYGEAINKLGEQDVEKVLKNANGFKEPFETIISESTTLTQDEIKELMAIFIALQNSTSENSHDANQHMINAISVAFNLGFVIGNGGQMMPLFPIFCLSKAYHSLAQAVASRVRELQANQLK